MADDIVKWIKIKTNMFDDEKIDFITSLPEADAIIVIWIRLLSLAGKCNAGGYIYLTEKIPYTDDMLSHKFRKPITIIKLALNTLQKLGMIEYDEGIIFLTNWVKHQNIEGLERIRERDKERKRKVRANKKPLLIEGGLSADSPRTVVGCPQTDKDKDLDKDKELDKETKKSVAKKTKPKILKNVFGEKVHLSVEEYEKLINEHGENDTNQLIDILDNWYLTKGNKPYDSDYHTMIGRGWVLKKFKEEQTEKPKARNIVGLKPRSFDAIDQWYDMTKEMNE